jgi:hypothetical protein
LIGVMRLAPFTSDAWHRKVNGVRRARTSGTHDDDLGSIPPFNEDDEGLNLRGAREVVATLATLAAECRQEGVGNPAVVVVGPVVALRASACAALRGSVSRT